MTSVAVIQLARMGDILQSAALVESTKRAAADLTMVVDRRFAGVAEMIHGVDRLVTLDLVKWSRCLKDGKSGWPAVFNDIEGELKPYIDRFDHIINLNYSPIATALAGYLSSGREVSGFIDINSGDGTLNGKWASYMIRAVSLRRWNRIHLVDIFRRFYPGDCTPDPPAVPVRLRIKDKDRQWASDFLKAKGLYGNDSLVGIHIGAGHPLRRWPSVKFRELLNIFYEINNPPVLLMGGPGEINEAGALADADGVVSLIGETSTGQMAAIMEECKVFISSDTGPLHLATASGCKVIGLYFGPAFCFETGPYGEGHWVIQSALDCAPCKDSHACRNTECRDIVPVKLLSEIVEGLLLCSEPINNTEYEGVRVYRSHIDRGGLVYKEWGVGRESGEDRIAGLARDRILGMVKENDKLTYDDSLLCTRIERLLTVS